MPQRNLLREKFYAEVQPFAERMKKKDATVRERTEALYALVVQNQVQEKLEERRCQFEQQGQEAFAKEYSQIYGIVMELLDKIVEVLGDEKMTLAEYQEILEAGFAEASVGIIPPTADQVLIGDNEITSEGYPCVVFRRCERRADSASRRGRRYSLGV